MSSGLQAIFGKPAAGRVVVQDEPREVGLAFQRVCLIPHRRAGGGFRRVSEFFIRDRRDDQVPRERFDDARAPVFEKKRVAGWAGRRRAQRVKNSARSQLFIPNDSWRYFGKHLVVSRRHGDRAASINDLPQPMLDSPFLIGKNIGGKALDEIARDGDEIDFRRLGDQPFIPEAVAVDIGSQEDFHKLF